MVNEIVAVAEEVPSDAVTVNVVAANVTVGVPDTTPVEVLNVRPDGKDGVIENVFVPGISVAVYAVVAVIGDPATPFTLCVDGDRAGAAETGVTESGANPINTLTTTRTRITWRKNDRVIDI